jgi:hypothetical protein
MEAVTKVQANQLIDGGQHVSYIKQTNEFSMFR